MQAVTLVEVLITMMIIGVIAVFAITTIKPYEKTYKYLYTRIFNVLETGVYNSMLKRSEFPATSTGFCTMLTEYLNVAEDNCNTAPDLPKPVLDPTGAAVVIPEESIKLVLSNGMYVWIGAKEGGAPYVINQAIPNDKTYSLKYYLVYVDITGSKPPNRVEWEAGGKLADIVAFAVTEASVVIPLGPPEIDIRYMTARTIYIPYDENYPEGNRSGPVTYAEAKALAWGTSMVDTEIRSWKFNTTGVLGTDSPFLVTYPTLPSYKATEQCTNTHGKVSPCYVKIDNYN